MDRLAVLVNALDHTLNTRAKRHIAGGILLSVSLLFGGLAITVLTLKNEETLYDEKYID